MPLVPNKPFAPVFLCKTRSDAQPVLLDTPRQIGCDADNQGAILPIGQDVYKTVTHRPMVSGMDLCDAHRGDEAFNVCGNPTVDQGLRANTHLTRIAILLEAFQPS